MTKQHLTPDGPRPCKAEKGKCKYSDNSEHFDSFEEAQKEYQRQQGGALKPALSKSNSSKKKEYADFIQSLHSAGENGFSYGSSEEFHKKLYTDPGFKKEVGKTCSEVGIDIDEGHLRGFLPMNSDSFNAVARDWYGEEKGGLPDSYSKAQKEAEYDRFIRKEVVPESINTPSEGQTFRIGKFAGNDVFIMHYTNEAEMDERARLEEKYGSGMK